MILVTGATGTTGQAVIGALLEQGQPVRALVHTAAKVSTLPAGVEHVVGSLEAPPAEAFADVDAVYLVSPASPQQADTENAFVDALVASGSGAHLVKLVAAGVEVRPAPVRFNAQHQQVLDHVAGTDVPLTVLAPNSFMSNLLFSAGSVREQGALYNSAADGAVSFIHPADIGAVAAHILADPTPHAGATYTLTGPEALTYAQVAEKLAAVTGKPVQHVSVEPQEALDAMVGSGFPQWNAEGLVELDAIVRQGYAAPVSDEVTKATGRPARSFDGWLGEHTDAFAG